MVVVDTDAGVVLEKVEHALNPVQGGAHIALGGTDAQGGFVELWDIPTRARTHRLVDPALPSVAVVAFGDDDRVVFAHETGPSGVAWDAATGARILAYPTPPALPSVPGLSPDGRWAAYGTVGTTFLFDRKAGKVVATSNAIHVPSSFAFFGQSLAVGDSHHACLFAIPQMTKTACTAEIRPAWGVNDLHQMTTVAFAAGGAALVATSGDAMTLVASVPTMKTIWSGRAYLSQSKTAAWLVDLEHHMVLSIGAGGLVSPVRALDEMESIWTLRETHPEVAVENAALARLAKTTCHVDTWVFPAVICKN